MRKPSPIRVGDRFHVGGRVWEVIETRPVSFHSRYTREMRDWPRAIEGADA